MINYFIDHKCVLINLFVNMVKCSFFHWSSGSGFTQDFTWKVLIISFVIIKLQKGIFLTT